MAVKLKEEANKEVKGELVSFNNDKDYVAIVLKSDNKTYVEHKLFAQKLVERKLAEYAKGAKLEISKSNTSIL